MIENVLAKYGEIYSEINNAKLFIKNNLKNEEIKFSESLNIGLDILNKEIKKLGSKKFKPEIAYKLYDTYGFPVDMTNSILKERNFELEMAKYKEIVEIKKKEQRKTWVGNHKKDRYHLYNEMLKKLKQTKFCGYESDSCTSKLIKIFDNGKLVYSSKGNDNIVLVFDTTPFYAEAGGQVGDSGNIFDSKNNLVGRINDTQKMGNGVYIHFLDKSFSELKTDEKYFLEIDRIRRNKISNNHSATHLLHESLRQIVGQHVSQRGSFVSDTRLRFDYSSNDQLSIDLQKKVEAIVNNSIRLNIKSDIQQMSIKKAKDKGAIALFGEKYSEIVRVVSIVGKKEKNVSEFKSIELCGGTHANYTGDIGMFKIMSDVSIASGVRRIEALTGRNAEKYFDEQIHILGEIKHILKANNNNILEKIKLLKNVSSESKNRKTNEEINYSDDNIIEKKNFNIYYDNLNCLPKELRNSADKIKKSFDSGIIILSTAVDKKVSVVVSVANPLIDKFDSNEIIKKIISFLGGNGGGGRRDLSQGGAPLNIKFKNLKKYLQKNIS